MIFGWFDTRAATAAGTSLAEFLAQSIVPGSSVAAKRKSEKKQHEAVPKLFAQADRLRHELELNVFKKARLANAFKWKLLDLGFEEDFVDQLTKELLLRL